MKKVLSFLLVLAILAMCCSCSQTKSNDSDSSQQTEQSKQEQRLKEAESVAKIVVEHTLHYRQYDILPYLAVDIDNLMYKHPIGLDIVGEGIIQWDGKVFEKASDFFKAYQENFEYVYDSFSINVITSSLSQNVNELVEEAIKIEYSNVRGESLSDTEDIKEAYESVYIFPDVTLGAKVDFDVAYTKSGETTKATMSVILLDINGEWKAISPTALGMQWGMAGPYYRYIEITE